MKIPRRTRQSVPASILTKSSWFRGQDDMIVALAEDTPVGYRRTVLRVDGRTGPALPRRGLVTVPGPVAGKLARFSRCCTANPNAGEPTRSGPGYCLRCLLIVSRSVIG